MGGTPAQSVKCKSILILQSAENSHTGSVYAVFHCSNTVGTGQPTPLRSEGRVSAKG